MQSLGKVKKHKVIAAAEGKAPALGQEETPSKESTSSSRDESHPQVCTAELASPSLPSLPQVGGGTVGLRSCHAVRPYQLLTLCPARREDLKVHRRSQLVTMLRDRSSHQATLVSTLLEIKARHQMVYFLGNNLCWTFKHEGLRKRFYLCLMSLSKP